MNPNEIVSAVLSDAAIIEHLHSSHHQELDELISSRRSFVGIPKDQYEWTEAIQQATRFELKDLLRQPDSVSRVFGLRINSRLEGALVTHTSPNQACWMIRTAYVAPGAAHDTIARMLDFACDVYESVGLKRFLAMYTEKSFERYTRLNHRTHVMERYVGTTEFRLNPNTRPRFLDYWEYLYGRLLFPEPTIVRAFNLVDATTSTFAHIPEAK